MTRLYIPKRYIELEVGQRYLIKEQFLSKFVLVKVLLKSVCFSISKTVWIFSALRTLVKVLYICVPYICGMSEFPDT